MFITYLFLFFISYSPIVRLASHKGENRFSAGAGRGTRDAVDRRGRNGAVEMARDKWHCGAVDRHRIIRINGAV
jgi:hypothetical protein